MNTVFTWPMTWNESALKVPIHMYCEMFTQIASKHDADKNQRDSMVQ